MNTQVKNTIDVLGLQDANGCSAVALDMDIWGYGATVDEAVEECLENAIAQITFALHKNDLSLLDRPIAKQYRLLFMYRRIEALRDTIRPSSQQQDTLTSAFAYQKYLPESLSSNEYAMA